MVPQTIISINDLSLLISERQKGTEDKLFDCRRYYKTHCDVHTSKQSSNILITYILSQLVVFASVHKSKLTS